MLRVLSQYHTNPTIINIANLQMLISTPIKVSLTLAEILKVKLEMWQEVTTCLDKMGIPTIESMNKEERV